MKTSESIFLDIRGLRYHVRSWGRQGAPKLFMLHGWMDASASFQFFVDALQGDWHVLAPDLRGYGQTQWQGSDTYWFPDYVADLDLILEHFQPQDKEGPVNLGAHSFGGNIAAVYAGSMPHRIRRYVNIDAFGPRAEGVKSERLARLEEKNDDAPVEVPPKRYADWLNRIRKGSKFRDFDDFAALEKRLQKEHPRVTPERIAFLARHWGRLREDGRVMMATDPHNAQNDGIHMSVRMDQAMACWRNITAPVLWVIAEEGSLRLRARELADGGAEQRLQHFLTRREVRLPDTGHMVHLEKPERLAELVEAFMTETP